MAEALVLVGVLIMVGFLAVVFHFIDRAHAKWAWRQADRDARRACARMRRRGDEGDGAP